MSCQRGRLVLQCAVCAACIGSVIADSCATQSNLFIPLVVYFFLTLVAGLGGLIYLLYHRTIEKALKSGAEGTDGEVDTAMAGSSLLITLPRQSWEINPKELKYGPRIGVGNVGEVYRGMFRGRVVAIKKLLGSWYSDEDMISRFREEIALMATMNHPNVLQFVGAVLDKGAGHMCLVTEMCARGTLYDVLHGPDVLPWRTRVKMAWDVARGMGYLHEQARVIQRDLKTQNLLVTDHFDVKVADFGLSRSLAPIMETYCGTPATMAPEIVRQDHYDERADVFSFSIIMWELLTREEPYPGLTGIQLAIAVANDGLRPPIPAYCPLEWAALMVRCWDADPDVRPSFDAIQREMHRILNLLDEADAAAARTNDNMSIITSLQPKNAERKKRNLQALGKEIVVLDKATKKTNRDNHVNRQHSSGGDQDEEAGGRGRRSSHTDIDESVDDVDEDGASPRQKHIVGALNSTYGRMRRNSVTGAAYRMLQKALGTSSSALPSDATTGTVSPSSNSPGANSLRHALTLSSKRGLPHVKSGLAESHGNGHDGGTGSVGAAAEADVVAVGKTTNSNGRGFQGVFRRASLPFTWSSNSNDVQHAQHSSSHPKLVQPAASSSPSPASSNAASASATATSSPTGISTQVDLRTGISRERNDDV